MFSIILAACAAVIVVSWMAAEAFRVRVDREEVLLKRLPATFDGTRLFFISDIHRRSISDELIEAVKKEGGADLVLIGGDIREKGVPLERTRMNIRKLSQLAPVYAVYGNHDYDEDIRNLDVLLREEGVRVLMNESVYLEQKDGARIRLTGVDDPIRKRDNIRKATAFSNQTNYVSVQDNEPLCSILLAHEPSIADRLPEPEEFDLILSGHTHGGQIVLPLIGPVFKVASIRPYLSGWFDINKKTTGDHCLRLFVSCGYGTSKIPVRFGVPPHSHLFILRCRS